MTKNALFERGPKNSGMGRPPPPPPYSGNARKKTFFFSLKPSLINKALSVQKFSSSTPSTCTCLNLNLGEIDFHTCWLFCSNLPISCSFNNSNTELLIWNPYIMDHVKAKDVLPAFRVKGLHCHSFRIGLWIGVQFWWAAKNGVVDILLKIIM